MSNLARFLDAEDRLKSWPAKKGLQAEAIEHIAGKFERGRFYAEREVNQLIDSWHTFGDYFLIRRSLIEGGYLSRTANGSRYWRDESASRSNVCELINANYDIGAIRSLFRLSDGYGSNSYYLSSAAGDFVLKEMEQNGMNHPENEAAILDRLRDAGIPVSVILPTRDGNTVLQSEGATSHLQKYVEGKIYRFGEAPEWLLYESATMLGKIQAAMTQLPPLPTGMGQSYFQPTMVERAISRGQEALALATERADARIIDAVNRRLRLLRTLAGTNFALDRMTCANTHGDYKLGQIIAGKDRINAVIDFTSACVHPICWEVIRAYYSTDGTTDGGINLDRFRKFVACFLQHGSLNDYDLKMMPSVYYYQNLISDYFSQYYRLQNVNKEILLADSLRYLKQCEWIEQNMTELEDALSRGF